MHFPNLHALFIHYNLMRTGVR